MPHLARLMQAGAITPLEPLWPNCQTPPSLFSIWSGQPASEHQIWGFDTPDGTQAGTFRNGFTRWPAALEMVWETWARAGHDVRLNHIPFVNEAKLGDRLVARSSVYGETFYDSQVFHQSTRLTVGEHGLSLTLQRSDDEQALIHVDGDGVKFTGKLLLNVFSDIPLPAPLEGTLTLMVTLTVGYYPVIDLALHEILNIEAVAESDDEVAAYFRQILLWAEEVVATLEGSCREGERLVINSDHGMQPVFDTFYLNHYLALHGWLTFTADGEIDYANRGGLHETA